MAAKRRAARKVGFFDIPGAFFIVIGLIFLAVAWPTVAFHGTARWIGEGLWVGIPILLLASFVGVHMWTHRDERKLKRLRDKRLWAEGKHPSQLLADRQLREAAQHRQAAEDKRKAAIDEAELRRQMLQANIKREEERLRELGLLKDKRR